MSDKRKTPSTAPARLTVLSLAKLAGDCTVTVSRALADSPLVAAATRERIQRLAREHGYKLNVNAQNLRLRRNHPVRPSRPHAVAVILQMTPFPGRTPADPYPLALLGGISQELISAGNNVLLTTRHERANMTVQGADGLMLLGQGVHHGAMT